MQKPGLPAEGESPSGLTDWRLLNLSRYGLSKISGRTSEGGDDPKTAQLSQWGLAHSMETAALVIIAIRQFQIHLDQAVFQIEVADDDLLNSVPLGLDLTAQLVCNAAFRLVVRRWPPRGYRGQVESDCTCPHRVVGAFRARKLLNTRTPALCGRTGPPPSQPPLSNTYAIRTLGPKSAGLSRT